MCARLKTVNAECGSRKAEGLAAARKDGDGDARASSADSSAIPLLNSDRPSFTFLSVPEF